MSHNHPHPQRQYGNNYKASDDPRDHQNKRVTSDPSRNRARDFSRDYPYDGMSRYKHHDGPQLQVPSMKVGIPEDYRYTPPQMGPMEAENHTPAQMAATSADNTRQPRRPAEGFEPFSRRRKKPVRDQKMNFPLADLLFKRASLHGEHPRSIVTPLSTQTTDIRYVEG